MLKSLLIIGLLSVLIQNNNQKIVGTWEFDYYQTQYDCDDKLIDYTECIDTCRSYYTFHKDNRFSGKIWGSKINGSYKLKNDTLYFIHKINETYPRFDLVYGSITDTLKLITFSCDQSDTLQYIRRK